MRKVTISFVRLPLRPSAWNNSAPTMRIFMKFDICVSFENLYVKTQLSLNSDKNTLHEDRHTFLIISHSFLLRMRTVSDKSCKENQTHIFCCITIFFKSSFRCIIPFAFHLQLNRGSFESKHNCLTLSLFNPLQTKRRSLYLKTQSVPRCKYSSSRL